jgi:hypothetical protein
MGAMNEEGLVARAARCAQAAQELQAGRHPLFDALEPRTLRQREALQELR